MFATCPPSFRAFLLVALFASYHGFASRIAAQDFRATIVGRVLDAETDLAVEGASASGEAFLVNVPPGDYQLTFTHTKGGTCTAVYGWKTATRNKVRLTVLADTVSWVDIACN